MSFRLRIREKPSDGVRRIARRELDLAVRRLRGPARKAVRVHNARKHLKKLRALLRLVRGRTGEDFFHTHNQQLRDLGRQLAPMRDAEVARLTLGQSCRTAATTQARRAASNLRRLVATEISHEARGATLKCVATELAKLRRAVARWPLAGLEWSELVRTTGRAYRRARIEREHFRLRRDLPSLHEWRKRSKDLWYQLLLLHPLTRPAARKLACQLDALTNTQGLMHDVQLVVDATYRHGSALMVWEREAVLELTGDRLGEFTGLALAQGRRVFQQAQNDFLTTLRAGPR